MKRTPLHHASDPEALGDALRQLPEAAPDAASWDRIRHRAATRQRRRRRWRGAIPLALAASVLLALGIGYTPHLRHAAPLAQTSRPVDPTKPVSTRNGETLAQLQRHSRRLEAWLSELRVQGAPLQGRALASAVDLQDRIGLIDLQLNAPGHAGDRRALWQQRVGLLQDLAMLRVSQSPLSDQTMMAESRTAYHL